MTTERNVNANNSRFVWLTHLQSPSSWLVTISNEIKIFCATRFPDFSLGFFQENAFLQRSFSHNESWLIALTASVIHPSRSCLHGLDWSLKTKNVFERENESSVERVKARKRGIDNQQPPTPTKNRSIVTQRQTFRSQFTWVTFKRTKTMTRGVNAILPFYASQIFLVDWKKNGGTVSVGARQIKSSFPSQWQICLTFASRRRINLWSVAIGYLIRTRRANWRTPLA